MEQRETNAIPAARESSKEGAAIPFHPRVREAYSVQFPLKGTGLKREIKVWHKSPSYMCLLVKEDSDILPLLKTGVAFKMNYYGNDVFAPTERLETEIRRIKKSQERSLKGYYFIEVGILRTYH